MPGEHGCRPFRRRSQNQGECANGIGARCLLCDFDREMNRDVRVGASTPLRGLRKADHAHRQHHSKKPARFGRSLNEKTTAAPAIRESRRVTQVSKANAPTGPLAVSTAQLSEPQRMNPLPPGSQHRPNRASAHELRAADRNVNVFHVDRTVDVFHVDRQYRGAEPSRDAMRAFDVVHAARRLFRAKVIAARMDPSGAKVTAARMDTRGVADVNRRPVSYREGAARRFSRSNRSHTAPSLFSPSIRPCRRRRRRSVPGAP